MLIKQNNCNLQFRQTRGGEMGGGRVTTKRYYYCNICHEPVYPAWEKTENGYGIYFTSNKAGKFDLMPVINAENHICFDCHKRLYELWQSEED
jgi:hypothetical protein